MDKILNILGPLAFDLGVPNGTRAIDFILSAIIPGPDDGKVAVDKARVEGMADFRATPYTHPSMVKLLASGCKVSHLESGVPL